MNASIVAQPVVDCCTKTVVCCKNTTNKGMSIIRHQVQDVDCERICADCQNFCLIAPCVAMMLCLPVAMGISYDPNRDRIEYIEPFNNRMQ